MRRTAHLLGLLALLGACGKVPTAGTTTAASRAQVASRGGDADLAKDLATLRRVTAPFHNFEKAKAAEWSEKITSCMADPTAGGMGFHYGNVDLINGSVQVDQPELLLYEPEKNGRLRLVAVEYIIPYTFHSRSAEPPVLFGQQFKQNDTFQLWGLHVWVWKENPNGMFASWNPRVTCAYTTDVMDMGAR